MVCDVTVKGAESLVRHQRYSYDAYGVPGRPDDGQAFRYTGRRYDAQTGLYYYRARYYSSELGRFLQTDPIGYEDNMNLYGYVGNDSVNKRDPNGKISERLRSRIEKSTQKRRAADQVKLTALLFFPKKSIVFPAIAYVFCWCGSSCKKKRADTKCQLKRMQYTARVTAGC